MKEAEKAVMSLINNQVIKYQKKFDMEKCKLIHRGRVRLSGGHQAVNQGRGRKITVNSY